MHSFVPYPRLRLTAQEDTIKYVYQVSTLCRSVPLPQCPLIATLCRSVALCAKLCAHHFVSPVHDLAKVGVKINSILVFPVNIMILYIGVSIAPEHWAVDY